MGIDLSEKAVNDDLAELKQAIAEINKKLEKSGGFKTEIEEIKDQLIKTFNSILAFNWILVSMGVVAFALAAYDAVGGKVDLAGLFGALGTADVISLFKFAMDRAQRNLGDQVQLVQVNNGHMLQMDALKKLAQNTKNIQELEGVDAEIRKATLNSMQLTQDFTKIAEPVDRKPWLRVFPIRYGELQLNKVDFPRGTPLVEDEPIALSCDLYNTSRKLVKVTAIAIAIRPPGGTPDGGPFRFDFYVDKKTHSLGPHRHHVVSCTKKLLSGSGKLSERIVIDEKLYGKDWYAFVTCQTEDGCWQDDHNKYWFELKKSTSAAP